ncbi:hypothetical protein [Stenotrophomonas sp. NPDC077659]|uniref:hypothetical protein n=1 Tax=Stenotrophomonas sp. NPDC077659 TaxID=3390694 RepID=UPI003D077E70
MLAVIAFAFTVPGYSSLSQHLSELGLMPGLPANVLTACIVANGAAIIVFSLALLGWGGRFALTAFTSASARIAWVARVTSLLGMAYL